MNKRQMLLMIVGTIVIISTLYCSSANHDPRRIVSVTRAESLPQAPVLDGAALILPSPEDFSVDMQARLRLTQRPKLREVRSLAPLEPYVRLVNALGGGIISGPGSRDTDEWGSVIHFIVYKTPKDALHYATREYMDLRQAGCGPGSFSGKKIGDLVTSSSSPDLGVYELHVVRNCVSFRIMAYAHGERTFKESMQSVIEEALETTANVIVKRIDGVVASKGRVDMSNLPPVRMKPVTQTD